MSPADALKVLGEKIQEAERIRTEAASGPWRCFKDPDDAAWRRVTGYDSQGNVSIGDISVFGGTGPFLVHARNTDPWAALKMAVEALDQIRCGLWDDPWLGAERALVEMAEKLGGKP